MLMSMKTSGEAQRAGASAPAKTGRLYSVTMIAVFDIAGPLAAYYLLQSAGLTAVTALLLSGTFPALGVTISAIRNRRLDAVGALVLTGILIGTVVGLVTHSARLMLLEGSVPTAIFGAVCLGSLLTRQPLMFRLAREFAGPDSARGREMTMLWQHQGYRQVLQIITAVWGIGFLIEAGLRVVIVLMTSTGTALAISRVMPFVFGAILSAWTLAYGAHRKRQGERMMAARAALPQTPAAG
jgi:intracellular septation protein A